MTPFVILFIFHDYYKHIITLQNSKKYQFTNDEHMVLKEKNIKGNREK